jgi:hypothetical protein
VFLRVPVSLKCFTWLKPIAAKTSPTAYGTGAAEAVPTTTASAAIAAIVTDAARERHPRLERAHAEFKIYPFPYSVAAEHESVLSARPPIRTPQYGRATGSGSATLR